jgi:hypothetical protein
MNSRPRVARSREPLVAGSHERVAAGRDQTGDGLSDTQPVTNQCEGVGMSVSPLEDGDVVDSAGNIYDLREAIEHIPWVTATRYPPPHQYVVLSRCPTGPWDVLWTAIRDNPDSYLAYFRGYRRPNRYFEFEHWRYWRTSSSAFGNGITHMLNRGRFEDAEPPRRVDEGALAIDWEGPPWDVYGSSWPPEFEVSAGGYKYRRELDRRQRRET